MTSHTKLQLVQNHYVLGFIIVLDGKSKHLVLFDHGLFNKICDKIKYFISKKSRIADIINYNFGKIRIDSCNSLPIEKVLTFHNVVTFIKSVVNRNKNEYTIIYF